MIVHAMMWYGDGGETEGRTGGWRGYGAETSAIVSPQTHTVHVRDGGWCHLADTGHMVSWCHTSRPPSQTSTSTAIKDTQIIIQYFFDYFQYTKLNDTFLYSFRLLG